MVLGRGARLRVLDPDAHMPPVPRIGNLLVPNDNYCKFEDWLMPILDQMVLEQNTEVRLEEPGGGGGWHGGFQGRCRWLKLMSPPRV